MQPKTREKKTSIEVRFHVNRFENRDNELRQQKFHMSNIPHNRPITMHRNNTLKRFVCVCLVERLLLTNMISMNVRSPLLNIGICMHELHT